MGRIGLVALALGLAAVPCVHAGALSIHRVEVDEAAGQMRISGDEFGNDEPSVTLEGIPMVVVSHSPTEIVITLPPGTTPGTYLLNVWRLDGNREQGVFNVTVGAEGPQGAQGVPGPQGPQGGTATRLSLPALLLVILANSSCAQNGKPTASGEIYDMDRSTAAHQRFVFGTRVRVENLENGKSTQVRINDRGPFKKGRIIDLSRSAARDIDMIGPGTARVRLVVLDVP